MNKATVKHFSGRMDMFKRFVMVLALCAVVFTAFGVRPVAAKAPDGAAASTTNPSVSRFVSCIRWDVQNLGRVKKLSPQGYQDLEKVLNVAIAGSGFWSNQYVVAVRTGAALAKFFGYDFIWALGMVQDCWRYL
jgi:hypothetical protein